MNVLRLFGREQKGVHGAALLLAFASVGNAVLALGRDRLLAGTFGASLELDIYYAAFRIPDLIFAFSLLFVASTAFIPVFLEHSKEGKETAKKVLDSVFATFLLVIGVLVVIAYILLPLIIPFTVPGFTAESQATVLLLARLLLLSPLLLGISNLVSGVIQSFKRFIIYALSPICYNVGIIAGIILFVPRFGLLGVVWGVALGALLHLLVQAPSLITLGYIPKFGRVFNHDVRQIIRLSFPRTLALSFHQLTFFVVTIIASTLGAGSIAIFHLAFNLQSFPLVVVGLSYSVAAFPTLARFSIEQDRSRFFHYVTSAVRHILFWTIPASVLFIVLRAHIVRVVLGTGSFDWADTRLTAASIFLFSFGIVAQSLIQLFVRSFYALGKTREPALYNFFGFLFVITFSMLLLFLFQKYPFTEAQFARMLRVGDITDVRVLVLPLAYAIGVTLNALLLGWSLSRVDGKKERLSIERTFAQVLGASAVMGIATFVTLRVISLIIGDLDTFTSVFFHAFISGGVGIIAGIVVLLMLQNKEIREFIRAFRERFWDRIPVQPETETEHL